jgi:glycine/D-amino acid oxidase-like deaminating enzyme
MNSIRSSPAASCRSAPIRSPPPLTPEQATALLPSNVCVTDNQFVLDYFRRTPDNRLLFGGGCTYLGGMPKDIAAATRPFLERVFPQLKGVELQFAWGGHIDLTMNRTPDVGGEGNRYWLQGYSGTACCRHWPPPARCPMQFSARRMNWRCIRA